MSSRQWRRVSLICDARGCRNEVVGGGVTLAEANVALAKAAITGGWKLSTPLEETFADAEGRRTSDPIFIERLDLCPTCRAMVDAPQPPEAA